MTAGLGSPEDHPRACGENGKSFFKALLEGGSPPRVRGKLRHEWRILVRRGITPACAGKTLSSPSLMRGAKDHPRVCGENRLSLRGKHTKAGSPPRVRGKHHVIDFAKVIIGITPACAGKTSARTMLRTSCRDHPRVCGENGCPSRPFAQQYGSPPRVRGKPGRELRRVCRERITPACAGKTCAVSSARLPMWNHPRVCGENRCELRYATD